MVRLSSPRNERQDQFAEVSSLLRFYYPVYPDPVLLSSSRPPSIFVPRRLSLSLNLRSHAQMTRTRLAPYAFLLSYYSP